MIERWADVPGFSGYQISSLGRVRSFRVGKSWKILAAIRKRDGNRTYVTIDLYNNSLGRRAHFKIHRLLYELFVGPIPDGLTVDHIDGNGENNELCNLRLASSSQQCQNRKKARGAIFKGVYSITGAEDREKRWGARIMGRHIGAYATARAAAVAYNDEAIRLYGEFAKVNVLD